jgi:DNA-binding NarL/FixJ family response regulator
VFSGGLYLPPEMRGRSEARAPDRGAEAGSRRPLSPVDLGLTRRQLEVAALMMRGKSNKIICRDLNIAEATVKNHITAIFRALKVTNRTEAAIAISELGWKLP